MWLGHKVYTGKISENIQKPLILSLLYEWVNPF